MGLDKMRDETSGVKTMKLEGLDLRYYDQGTGDAVVFLHGWGSEFSIFRPFLDRMSNCRRVCAPNLPGFGGSEEPPAAWGVDDYADFVRSFLKKLGIREAVLIGHSFGGRIIIKLAARSGATPPSETLPLRLHKIILVDSAGIRPGMTLKKRLRLAVYKGVRQVARLVAAEKLFPGLLESWRRRNASPDYRDASPRMRECFVKIINEDLTPFLSSISCPTLLIWGENDRETPLGDGQLMERLVPDSGLVTLKNAGHYSFLDQPFIFGRVLDSFLGLKSAS
ncbi:MAG: alpha/beta hydrolase [Synergistaceae bacterium]|jgi:pimeloyl-ACP methyl ester carboxylesterase|nr:alpha/beta hydrolase [Synergistaceae bacterium]